MTDADERPAMREMPSAECWQRVAAAPYGRLGTYAGGEMDLFPVNHGVDRFSVVFRTAPGTKLLALTVNQDVLFQVDGIDGDEVFSIVMKGRATRVEREREIEEADRLGLVTWAPGRKDRWVRVTPRDIQGRAFTLPAAVTSAREETGSPT